MKKKRDSEYFAKRLAKDYPAIFAEVRPRGPLSIRAASVKAGLIHLPTRVDALKREWKRATEAQRVEFLHWLRAAAVKRVAMPIADAGGRLRPEVRAFLSHWVRSNRSKPGRIMRDIGFSRSDYTLSAAISRGDPMRAEVIPKLSVWLTSRGFR